MTEEQKAAFVMAQAAAALIEAFGMISDNIHRQSLGYTIAYDSKAFNNLAARFGIYHNDVCTFFQS